MELEERFWTKVDRRSDDDCWPWVGAKNVEGYGFMVRSKKPILWWRAHRFSWEIHNGAVPDGMLVLHHCDNPSCVNPAHLWVGTAGDNNRDRDRKGRGRLRRGYVTERAGEKNGNAKLSDSQVAEIRTRYATGSISQQALADEYGICQAHVSDLVRRKRRP